MIIQGGINMEYTHCPYCGNEISREARFCTACGNQIQRQRVENRNGFDAKALIVIILTVLSVALYLSQELNFALQIVAIAILLVVLWIKPNNSKLRLVLFIIDLLLVVLFALATIAVLLYFGQNRIR